MPILLQLRDAHKRYGPTRLLDGAETSVADGQKIGLIGRNGAGKSTLCRILLGDEELDSGEVWRHPKLRLGYLRQHDPFLPGETILDFLLRDSQRPDWRCGEVAWQFEIHDEMLRRPVAEMSGGWQTRVKLAALLLHEPNLLLLDEPTNFLDLRTQIMLEHFLRTYRGACLVVSHDRTFLRDTCTHTLELARGKLTFFSGNVDAFLEHQRERREHDERVNAALQAKKRQLVTFIDKNRGKPAKAKQARSKAKQVEWLDERRLEIEGPESAVRVRVPQIEPRQGTALRCQDLSIGYPDRLVASGVDVEVLHGARIAVVGDNGQGKTTFLRTATGSLAPLAGGVKWGYGCDVGTYAQHVYTSLPDDWTVQEYLADKATGDTRSQTVLDVAGSFLFRGEDIEKRIGVLSGGERARLCLAGLLLGRHNVLVLDEPANHLDVDTLEALADALVEYRGTVVFTSHDRHFMGRVTTGVVEVRDGRVAEYPGDYGTYVYRVEKEIDEGTRPQSSAAKAGRSERRAAQESSPLSAADRKVQQQREREQQKQLTTLERKIAKLEAERRALNDRLLLTRDAAEAQRLHREMTEIAGQIKPLEEQWIALQP